MNNQKIVNDFNKIVSYSEKELEQYDLKQLLLKENDGWSMGQLYNHLIQGTLSYHLPQIEKCINSDTNKSKTKNFKGFVAFSILKGFPPIKIKVPDSDVYTPKQPKSIDEIKKGFEILKQKMNQTLINLANDKKGKTAHPGFSYLNATEWFRLIPMHFKHHLRQKESIDKYLNLK